ncbi:MAG: hypothetical protein HRT35_12690, partial [Algicola sp.]|nr:hypothetical protein [Algicola sp.]
LKRICQDPLFLVLALILLIVVLLFFGVWLLRSSYKLLSFLLGKVAPGGKKLFAWVTAPFAWVYRRLSNAKQQTLKKPRWQWVNLTQMRRAVNAMKYLTTKRDWRYNMPWFLLIGEQGSGKSELIKAATEDRKVQLLPREKHLKDPGSGWHFFNHAVVIDQDNKNQDSGQAARFSYLIELLHWYRPERPVDGILLTVSANTLLHKGDGASLSALGENLFQQLWQSQKHSGFVLPVYLVVTQCDHVEGFDAFWQAQPRQKRQEMVGWSNPYRLDSAYSKSWVKEAFDQVTKNLQDAQLAVAAGGQEIGDIDRFMLFLHHFGALYQPLSEVVTSAFARSSFQEALPLRGIYFTGQVQEQQAFVNDLMIRKVFAEKHLAFPTEKRRFSSHKTIRRFQLATLAGAVALAALMAIDSLRLQEHSRYTAENLQRLFRIKQDCSREGLDTYRILSSVSDISDRPLLLSLPMSWFNGQVNQEKRLIADKLFKTVFFASLECRLKIRASSLRLLTEQQETHQNYRMVINDIKKFGGMLQDFQINRERFLTLAGPLNDSQGIGKELAGLIEYLYDRPMPAGVDPAASLTTGAIKLLDYNVDWDEQGDSLIGRAAMMNHLDGLTKTLHQALIEHAQRLPLAELRQISENIEQLAPNVALPPSPLLDNIDLFQAWLLATEKDWLSATAATSPCGNVYQLLSDLSEPLASAGFDDMRLNDMVELFSQEQCDALVQRKLVNLNVPPFGSMFERNEQRRLEISPVLQQMTNQIESLESLSFVKATYPPMSDTAEPVVAWLNVPLQQLLNTLLSYQGFLDKYAKVKKPFFANTLSSRLQQVSQRLLSEAMVRPTQLAPISYLLGSPETYNETALGKSVASFKANSGILLQIISLLRQLGDNSNTIRLQQDTHTFVMQQLQKLEQLVAQNQLYLPVESPRWDDHHFADSLFNLQSDQQTTNYLTGQRQRMSFLAYNYAEPLISFLRNSERGLTDNLSQRWLNTISDLGRFERNEPGNAVKTLDNFISETLTGLNNDNCFEQAQFSTTAANDGWFATRRLQLQRQVNMHCQDAGDNKVIKRYLAIRDRFNQQLAGRFPFAPIFKAGASEIKRVQLRRFLQYYRRTSKTLLADMNAMANYQPGSIPESWPDFIGQMNRISEFFKRNWVAGSKRWQVGLNVKFDAMPARGHGTNQIINWTLGSGKQQLNYPNGGDQLLWQSGAPLSLGLRWATGSAYVPSQLPGVALDAPLQVDAAQLTARFNSKGDWGLFEWLARYGEYYANGHTGARQDERLLSFHVPVVLKASTTQPKSQAYVSQSNLLLWVEISDVDGQQQRLPLPGVFPAFAPGFN